MKFLIKHNFRREDRYAIAEELKSVCKNVKHPREGKTVYIGSTWRNFETKKDGKFAIRMVYEITERTTSADGQEMLFPETEIDMPVRHSMIKRRRIRTVIDNLILIAGHLTDHARKLRLSLGHCNGWICTFLRVGNSL